MAGKQTQLIMDGNIPVDCTGREGWSGNMSFEIGPARFEVLGFAVTTKGKSPAIQIGCKVTDGHEKNKGRTLNTFFQTNSDIGKDKLTFFVKKLAGVEGFRQGQPHFPSIKGAIFDAIITSREYADKNNPKLIKTSYDIELDSIALVSKAPALQPSAAQNIVPA
jgi:hypothetical protein